MQKEIQELVHKGEMLPLMEEFYTIQGEGYYKGTAAYFIRIGGCDVGCHWCDVKESWDADVHPATRTLEIAEKALEHSDTIVITGGEPLMWNMEPLTSALKKRGAKTHIETSGAYQLSGEWDWICLSPKKRKLPLDEVCEAANELKIIIFNKNDFKFAEKQAARVGKDCMLFIQPEWSKKDQMIPLMVEFVMKNPKWKMSLQTHKYMNIP